VFAMLLVVIVCVGNVALGFALAVHLGHGPTGIEWPSVDKVRATLRAWLRLGGTRS
jgi:hypothetical protein